MSLYDALADDVDQILVDMHGPGESVTYHPYGGDDVAISAVLSPEPANLLENEHGGESDVREGYLFSWWILEVVRSQEHSCARRCRPIHATEVVADGCHADWNRVAASCETPRVISEFGNFPNVDGDGQSNSGFGEDSLHRIGCSQELAQAIRHGGIYREWFPADQDRRRG